MTSLIDQLQQKKLCSNLKILINNRLVILNLFKIYYHWIKIQKLNFQRKQI